MIPFGGRIRARRVEFRERVKPTYRTPVTMVMPNVELKPPKVEERRRSWLGIVFALVFGLGVYVGLSFLTLGFFGPIAIVVTVVLGIVLFHYFVWGWWLGKVIREAGDDD